MLDVFLSSDQLEFQKLRQQLRDVICGIPFLICTLMEDRGADPSSAVDASLKAVRDSDIYVGVFGRKYSETTILEYQEAVKQKKPCLAYVKRARQRDERLEKFIRDVLERDFKYFPFGNDSKELTTQLELDLQNFIISTLRMGIQARAERLGKTIALISKEEKSALTYVTAQDPLVEAQSLFLENRYLESLLMTVAIIEATLRKVLASKGITASSSSDFGEVITLAKKSGILFTDAFDRLRILSIYRNQLVHLGDPAEKEPVREILESSRLLIYSLLGSGDQRSYAKDIGKLWKPFPKINFNVGQWVPRFCKFPQIAWAAYNESPYQLRVWIEVHPILGGRDMYPLKDNDINGKSFYGVEPESYVFANGCFTLPEECAISKEELVLEIRAIVEDINDTTKGKYKLLPKRWKYVRESNMWSYYPQQVAP